MTTQPQPSRSRLLRQLDWLIFGAAFLAFAYFHPGSDGSNAARFALTRAMVEEGRFTIDSYLVCFPMQPPNSPTRLHRVRVVNGVYEANGAKFVLCWTQPPWKSMEPFPSDPPPDAAKVELLKAALTFDLSFYDGQFHPNKAPGASFLAVPAYFVIYHVEQLFGLDPDEWWVLTVNAWLTSVFSVGLISALGCVVFFRLALKLSDGDVVASLLATLTLGLGTMYFIYATCQYEYNVAGAGLLAAFWLFWRVKERGGGDEAMARRNAVELVLAGLAAGWAAISNYIAAVGVLVLGIYLLRSVRVKRGWLWFGFGLLGPLVLVLYYNWSCFGMPLTTNYRDQAAFQKFEGAFLGVFGLPQWDVLLAILFSPFRGMLFFSPVLAMGVVGGVWLWRRRRYRAELAVCAGIVLAYLLFSICYRGWFGGFAVVPRYFAPAVAFVAVPMAVAFMRWCKTTALLAMYSVAVTLLIVAVNPFSPLGTHPMATIKWRPQWMHNQLTHYLLPMFLTGKPEPLIRDQLDIMVEIVSRSESLHVFPEEVRRNREAVIRQDLMRDIPTVRDEWYAVFVGEPVSANQRGMYEMWPYLCFPVGSKQAHWNSFNVGEFLFPSSRWSLSPLLVVVALLGIWAWRLASRADASRPNGAVAPSDDSNRTLGNLR